MKSSLKKILCTIFAIGLIAAFSIGMVACNDTDKVINVGYTIFDPMNYTDADGNFVGFDTELAKKVFTDLGYKVNFKQITWSNKYVDLKSGSIDCIWNGFTSNGMDDGSPRKDLVSFTYNYMKNYQAVVVNKNDVSQYTDIATSFNGKIGRVEKGSAGEEYAATFTGANVQNATAQIDALQNIAGGACDFVVVDYLLANSIVGKGNFSNLAIVESLNSDAEYYAVAFKTGSELTAKVNAQFEKYLADGSLLELATKYGLENALIKDYSDQK